MADIYDKHSRDDLLAEIIRLREMAARNGTTCMRYSIALKLARQYGIASRAFDGDPSVLLADWVDDGMKQGVPWPSSPFAQKWLREQGYSDCDGKIGIRVTMTLVDDKPQH